MKRTIYSLIFSLVICLGAISTIAQNKQVAEAEKYVLVEEGTGTWCSWCTGGTYYGDSLTASNDHVIFIAIHGSDPMEDTEYNDAAAIGAFPSANINRSIFESGINSWFSDVNTALSQNAIASVNVETEYDESTRELSATITALFDEEISGDYRLAAIITEDAVTGPAPSYDQSNSYSGTGDNMGGFQNLTNPVPATQLAYNHVGRKILGGYNGIEGSIPSSVVANEEHSYTFTYTLPESWNENYIKVVGILVNGSNGQIANAGKSDYLPGHHNGHPHFINEPLSTGYLNTEYSYNCYCADPDDNNISIEALTLPNWLEFEFVYYNAVHAHATIQGIPTETGEYPVVLAVTDGETTTEYSYTITVDGTTNGAWELVGEEGFSSFAPNETVIKVNSNGTAFVACRDYSNPLEVYINDEENWSSIGNPGTADSELDMDLDNDGMPWVLYNDATQSTKAVVKKYTGTGWEQVGTPVSNGAARSMGITFDKEGTAYVSFYEQTMGTLAYVYKWDGTEWIGVGDGPVSNEIALFTKPAFNNENTPYLLWAVAEGYSYFSRVSVFENNEWSLIGDGNISTEITYYQHDIAFDNENNLYVSICETTGLDLNVYKWEADNWVEITNGYDWTGEEHSMEVNNDNEICIAFKNVSVGNATSVMKYENAEWSSVGPLTISNGSGAQSMCLANGEIPYVSYKDDDNGENATVKRFIIDDIGIQSAQSNDQISIYPNPTSDIVQLISDYPINSWKIHNINGQVLKTGNLNLKNEIINLSEFKSGIYILTIQSGENIESKRLIIK
jgi:hypothetical protein